MPNPTGLMPMLAAVIMLMSAGLGGCVATTDFTYSEYQLGPDSYFERTYENRVYGDAEWGIGSETCRTTVRRQVNEFGELIDREIVVCDEF